MINGEIYPSIDVANITVNPKYKSRGVFKSLMDFIETEYRHRLIYAENILEPRLVDFFVKRGYTRVDKGDSICCRNKRKPLTGLFSWAFTNLRNFQNFGHFQNILGIIC